MQNKQEKKRLCEVGDSAPQNFKNVTINGRKFRMLKSSELPNSKSLTNTSKKKFPRISKKELADMKFRLGEKKTNEIKYHMRHPRKTKEDIKPREIAQLEREFGKINLKSIKTAEKSVKGLIEKAKRIDERRKEHFKDERWLRAQSGYAYLDNNFNVLSERINTSSVPTDDSNVSVISDDDNAVFSSEHIFLDILNQQKSTYRLVWDTSEHDYASRDVIIHHEDFPVVIDFMHAVVDVTSLSSQRLHKVALILAKINDLKEARSRRKLKLVPQPVLNHWDKIKELFECPYCKRDSKCRICADDAYQLNHTAKILEDLAIALFQVLTKRDIVTFCVELIRVFKTMSGRAIFSLNVFEQIGSTIKLAVAIAGIKLTNIVDQVSSIVSLETFIAFFKRFLPTQQQNNELPLAQADTDDLSSEDSSMDPRVDRLGFGKLEGMKASDWMETDLFKLVTRWISYLMYLTISKGKCGTIPFMSDLIRSMIDEGKRESKSILSFVIKSLEYAWTKGRQAIEFGFMPTFYHSEATMSDLCRRVDEAKTDFLAKGNPAVLKVDLHKLQFELVQLKKELKELCLVGKNSAKKEVQRLYADVCRMYNELFKDELIMKDREAPLCILTWGGTSVGKTYFNRILNKMLCDMQGLEFKDEYIYQMNDDKRADGFKTHMHTAIFDDVGNKQPDKCPNGDPTLMNIISWVNNAAKITEQAIAEDKGKIPVWIKFLLMTANTDLSLVKQYYTWEAAVRRRVHLYISLKLKKEFTKDNSDVIDTSKLNSRTMDIWLIKVQEYRVTSENKKTQTGKLVTIATFKSIFKFAQFVSIYQARHFAAERNRTEALKFVDDLSFDNDGQLINSETLEIPPSMEDIRWLDQEVAGDFTQQTDQPILMDSLPTDEIVNTYDRQSLNQTYIGSVTSPAQAGELYIPTHLVLSSIKCFGSGLNSLWNPVVEYTKSAVAKMYVGNLDAQVYDKCQLRTILERQLKQTTQDEIDLRVKAGMARIGLNVMGTINKREAIMKEASKFLFGEQNAISNVLSKIKTTLFILGGIAGAYGAYKVASPYIYTNSRLDNLKKDIILTELNVCEKSTCNRCENLLNKLSSKGRNVSTQELSEIHEAFCKSSVPQGSVLAKSSSDFWIDTSNILKDSDVGASSMYYKNKEQKFLEIVAANTILLKCEVESGHCFDIRALCLGGYTYVTNLHYVTEHKFVRFRVIQDKEGEASSNYNVEGSITGGKAMEAMDLYFFQLRASRPKKCLHNLFYRGDLTDTSSNGAYIFRNRDGSISQKIVQRATPVLQGVRFNHSPNKMIPAFRGLVSEETKKGDCGAPLVLFTHYGPIIAGLHVTGEDFCVSATQLSLRVIHKCGYSLYPDLSPVKFKMCNATKILLPERSISHPSFLPNDAVVTRYGTLKNAYMKAKTNVVRTDMAPYIEELGYKQLKTSPPMNSWRIFRNNLEAMTQKQVSIDAGILEKCKNAFCDLLDTLPQSEFDQLGVLDDFVNVNGMPGVDYIDGINRNTSMGFPINKSAKTYLYPVSTPTHPDGVMFDDEVMESFNRIDYLARIGIVQQGVCNASQKDEPISWDKAQKYGTRLFFGNQKDHALLCRKYMLSIVRLFQRNRKKLGVMVGIVCQSREWDGLAKSFPWKDRMLAGDFSKFDKKQNVLILHTAFDIIEHIMVKSKQFEEQDITALNSIRADLIYALVNYDGDLLSFLGVLPSGVPVTVLINSLCVILLYMYAYCKRSPNNSLANFFLHVMLFVYGDDSIASISPKCNFLTHVTMAEEMSQIGMAYTMAEKDAELTPFVDFKDCTFLKRRFVYNQELECYLAPLEPKNLMSSLTVWVVSKNITPEDQANASLQSNIREWFLHGREKFEEMKITLADVYKKTYNQEIYFPTYETVLESFERYNYVEPQAGNLYNPHPGRINPGIDTTFRYGLGSADSVLRRTLSGYPVLRQNFSPTNTNTLRYLARCLPAPVEILKIVVTYMEPHCMVCYRSIFIKKLCKLHYRMFNQTLSYRALNPVDRVCYGCGVMYACYPSQLWWYELCTWCLCKYLCVYCNLENLCWPHYLVTIDFHHYLDSRVCDLIFSILQDEDPIYRNEEHIKFFHNFDMLEILHNSNV